MKASKSTDRIEMTKLSKLIDKRQITDKRKCNMERIKHVLKSNRSRKAVKRKLGVGKNQMYALKDNKGNHITDMDKLVKVSEEFYTDPYTVNIN